MSAKHRERPNCPYYYEDYFRGRETTACRLIERNPRSRPWKRSLCDACPVPKILTETTCAHLALEATVVKKLLWERVDVYAVCTKHRLELKDPRVCPQCEAERAAGEHP